MRIREVEKMTGLTRKTVRFYEQKGLLCVRRSDNDYREYTDDDVRLLLTVARLRRAGVSLSDIQLWQDGVITDEEMLQKRLREINESETVSREQGDVLRGMLSSGQDGRTLTDRILEKIPPYDPAGPDGGTPDADRLLAEESEETGDADAVGALFAGVDIGTTSISAAVLCRATGRQLAYYTIRNDSFITPDNAPAYERVQDPAVIAARAKRLVDSILKRYPDVVALGLSGQMHGILYLDVNGNPVSPLYTWQDTRAALGNPSACDVILRETGYVVSPGFGLATAVFQNAKGEIPSGAASLCTVADYIGLSLCGLTRPVMHTTNAASLGLFDTASQTFDVPALEKLGFPVGLLPRVTGDTAVVGRYGKVSVTVAIGDNQAGFLGAVDDGECTALANFGTGSQISLLTDARDGGAVSKSIEARPFPGGRTLLCGSALCGGRAYRILERFIAAVIETYRGGDGGIERYDVLGAMAKEGIKRADLPVVRTSFCGTRDDPTVKGGIDGLDEDNFKPDALAAATLIGMAEELHDMYMRMPHGHITRLVASGNAARRNPVLLQALSRVFGVPVSLPGIAEEAAFGAARFACAACTESTI